MRVSNGDGSHSILFGDNLQDGEPLKLPCGQCIGCRLERSRQWATRCLHESQLHDLNCFVTLTFDDAHLPSDGSLNKSDLSDFMRRLRKFIASPTIAKDYPNLYKRKVSFYSCGEYGEKFSRPHYHICLFNFDFPDKVLVNSKGPLYESEMLSRLWSFGRHWIGDVTFESAAYVARYCTKKITGRMAGSHYERIDKLSGECVSVLPEFNLMSRRPGIATDWIKKYSRDVLNLDEVIVRGKKCRPSRFYDKYLEKNFPDDFEELKIAREENVLRHSQSIDNSPSRLNVRHEVQVLRNRNLSRSYEITGNGCDSDLVKRYDLRHVAAMKEYLKSKEEL